jgi:hypothetical protein
MLISEYRVVAKIKRGDVLGMTETIHGDVAIVAQVDGG